jgi:hypothetical protein
LLLGRIEARRVDFIGHSDPVALASGRPVVAIARGAREAEGSCGSEAAACHARQAGPVVRWLSATPGR